MWITLSSDGPSPSPPVEVSTGSWVVGRSPVCDVVVADPAVSDRHARLDVSRRGVWLTDLGSATGTFVAGDRLWEPARLVLPADFRVGDTTFRVRPGHEAGTVGTRMRDAARILVWAGGVATLVGVGLVGAFAVAWVMAALGGVADGDGDVSRPSALPWVPVGGVLVVVGLVLVAVGLLMPRDRLVALQPPVSPDPRRRTA